MATIAELYKARFGLDRDIGKDIPSDGTVADILNRRSLRRYTDQPVSDDLLDVLLACAQSAPAKSDLQQYSIVVDPARLDGHDLRTTEGSTAFLKDVLVKLDDIADETGSPLSWSDEVRDAVLCLPYARTALAAAYFKAMVGAREGN